MSDNTINLELTPVQSSIHQPSSDEKDSSEVGTRSTHANSHSFQRQVEIGDWQVRTRKMPILNSKEIKTFGEKLKIPLPEICFGNNELSISHRSSGFDYSWNTLDALLSVNYPSGDKDEEDSDEIIKVAYADHWSQARKATDTVTKVVNPYDWTYTATYCGTSSPDSVLLSTPTDASNHPGIPLAELTRPDPIIFFDEVTLFEDELHDNGMASLQVKVRVMPSCIFALSRFFLRVDGVIFRLMDVRLYIDVKTNLVIREVKAKEMAYADVKKRLPIEKPNDLGPLTDPNWVSQVFGMLNKEQLIIPSRFSNDRKDQSNSDRNNHRTWKNVLGTHLDVLQIS
ncbi:TIP41-like family-domain-containing protein [Phakopsora pachyrhizi]|uniref:TIP41-like family-domain-containing protein n=1 Tax=Phakopsora pachyrhizi TaxID=170000 RepID=A0AAV0AMH9_PHAPC|nr:TIP41-like family-domain-containing protein [Phakopsora pachyrhizi]CAH7668353.1 TIP41-like family-domain-containing protein [Phakopsora pachyrhizi]